MHYNGDKVTGAKKARINSKKADVAAVRNIWREITINRYSCSKWARRTRSTPWTTPGSARWTPSSAACKRFRVSLPGRVHTGQVFVSDEGDFSIAQMKADYEAMILAAKLRALEVWLD